MLPTGRIRRLGGGRKKVEVVQSPVLTILLEVVEASTGGSPTHLLQWTSNSRPIWRWPWLSEDTGWPGTVAAACYAIDTVVCNDNAERRTSACNRLTTSATRLSSALLPTS